MNMSNLSICSEEEEEMVVLVVVAVVEDNLYIQFKIY